jgi:hypothetical protein
VQTRTGQDENLEKPGTKKKKTTKINPKRKNDFHPAFRMHIKGMQNLEGSW